LGATSGSAEARAVVVAAIAAAVLQLVELLHGHVEHAVRHLDQLVVEVVVDLAVHVPDHREHAQQPHAADPDDQRAGQAAGERVAAGHKLRRAHSSSSAAVDSR
jgi:hypothetical protein